MQRIILENIPFLEMRKNLFTQKWINKRNGHKKIKQDFNCEPSFIGVGYKNLIVTSPLLPVTEWGQDIWADLRKEASGVQLYSILFNFDC